jgi:hypothetical protein
MVKVKKTTLNNANVCSIFASFFIFIFYVWGLGLGLGLALALD